MRDNLGSLWRWRLLLLLVWLLLIAIGWRVTTQWSARLLVPGGYGPPVVMRVVHFNKESLEAFDWRTGERWKLASSIPWLESQRGDGKAIRIVQGGKAVAWREWSTLHVMDISPPHARRSYPVGSIVNDREGLVGITRDEKMAVFCVDETWGGARAVTPAYSIRIVDLSTGREVATTHRNSSMASIDSSNEFFSIRSAFAPASDDDPLVGRWKLSSDATWERIGGERQWVFPDKFLSIAEAADGSLRLLSEKEGSPEGENVTQAVALAASPSGERFLASDGPPLRLMIGDVKTKQVRALPWSGDVSGAAFLEDGTTLVVSDTWDDLRVIDTTTGQTIGGEFAGSRRKWTLVALAVVFWLLAFAWAVVAWREASTTWAMVDIALLVVVARCGLFVLEPVFYYHGLIKSDPWDAGVYHGVEVSIFANATATAGLIGWYWVHGRGWVVTRWLHGLLWMLGWAVCLPLQTASTQSMGGNPLAAIGMMAILSLIVAGFVSAILLLTRGLGWTISDRPLASNPGRFDLLSFLTVVAGVAVWFGLLRNSWTSSPGATFSIDATVLRVAWYFAVNIAIVAVLFSSTTWPVRAALLLLLAIVLAITSYVAVRRFASVIMPGPLLFTLEAGIYVGTLQAILVPCIVLRARGWHWRRMVRQYATAPVVAIA